MVTGQRGREAPQDHSGDWSRHGIGPGGLGSATPQVPAGRPFAAARGLTTRANSSGGKERMGRISKMGDRYLRRLLVSGMTSQLRSARRNPDAHPWVIRLVRRKPAKLVAVAMAN